MSLLTRNGATEKRGRVDEEEEEGGGGRGGRGGAGEGVKEASWSSYRLCEL